MGPKFRRGALSSSGLSLSPGLPLTSALPRPLPVGCIHVFRSFQPLASLAA